MCQERDIGRPATTLSVALLPHQHHRPCREPSKVFADAHLRRWTLESSTTCSSASSQSRFDDPVTVVLPTESPARHETANSQRVDQKNVGGRRRTPHQIRTSTPRPSPWVRFPNLPGGQAGRVMRETLHRIPACITMHRRSPAELPDLPRSVCSVGAAPRRSRLVAQPSGNASFRLSRHPPRGRTEVPLQSGGAGGSGTDR
jgi:hypothetical protein